MDLPNPTVVETNFTAADDSPARRRGAAEEPVVEPRAAQSGWLLPREHGAYAGLAFPLITALALGRPNGAQILWIIGCAAVFLAHEPLLIMLGERGGRSRSELGERARKAGYFLSALALTTGAVGWWLAPAAARLALFLSLALGVLLLRLIFTHREHSLAGELLACLTLSSTLLPVALAGGVDLWPALTAGAIWCAVSWLATLTVRATIARVKQQDAARKAAWTTIASGFALAASVYSLALVDALPALVAIAVLPIVLVALACSIVPVHPRYLRVLGWSLVGSNLITLLALLIGLRPEY